MKKKGTTRGAAALRHPDLRWILASRLAATIGTHMQNVAIGWQVYSITGRAIDLGWVGLAQFLPAAGLALVSGHVADRFDRRKILISCVTLQCVCALTLWFLAGRMGTQVGPIYAVLVVFGAARAFQMPASQALLPELVPAEDFENAVAWNGSIWQFATILGPALGGAAYATLHARGVYTCCAALFVTAAAGVIAIRHRPGSKDRRTTSLDSLLAGVRYVWRKKLVLACTSLDLFAVLLGGATALLPIYAHDILAAGPTGLGMLRAAPAAGAALMGVTLAHHPVQRHVGRRMLAAVAVFGLGTIVFALSKSFVLSLVSLAVIGAADMISVVVRGTLVQLATPANMRGRVSAVNGLFIGASNELGEFESGLTASLLGIVPAAVLGGVGTCLVVALWSFLFPELRDADRLSDVATFQEDHLASGPGTVGT